MVTLVQKKGSRERIWGKDEKENSKKGQAAREGGDLRADHVFMQRVSGIVISS